MISRWDLSGPAAGRYKTRDIRMVNIKKQKRREKEAMRKDHKKMVACIGMSVMLAASVLQGCGGKSEQGTTAPAADSAGGATEASAEDQAPSNEDLLADMKEFATPDGSAKIHLTSDWTTEDMGVDFWLGAQSKNGADAVILMQFPKGGTMIPVTSMDSVKELVVESYGISGEEDTEAPEISAMKNVSAVTCTISADGESGDAYVAYGETDYAYYSVAFVSEKMDDDFIASIKASLSSFQEEPLEVEDNTTVEITDTVQWFNASYAVLTAVNGWDPNRFAGLPANDQSMELEKQMLDEWWGVTDRASADENLDWILSEGHRTGFAEDMGALADAGMADVAEGERVDFVKANFDVVDEEAESYANGFALYERFGENALAGWDYCRALSLMGYYYIAGYYTEEEALDKSLEIAQTLQPLFTSWDELMDSYLGGYEYWAGESAEERRGIYEELKSQADGPYRVDYGVTLEKTW